jgi:hypothetical protein
VDDKNDLEYRDVWVIYKHIQDPNFCLLVLCGQCVYLSQVMW